MNLSPEQIIAVGTSTAAIIGSIAAVIVGVRNGKRVEIVHGLVNSQAQHAREEIARLSKIISDRSGTPEDVRSSDEATQRAIKQQPEIRHKPGDTPRDV